MEFLLQLTPHLLHNQLDLKIHQLAYGHKMKVLFIILQEMSELAQKILYMN